MSLFFSFDKFVSEIHVTSSVGEMIKPTNSARRSFGNVEGKHQARFHSIDGFYILCST